MIQRVLRLYIVGHSAAARRAQQGLALLRARVPDCEVEIIDILHEPERAEQARVLATPTLTYEHAKHARRVFGDLADVERVLECLGLDVDELVK